ncbi:B-cell differentiation antigen CD72 [Hippopotamus amphibius kiboko]|uniref:B-cell differentiation antigen CD72 n=1 Tax=Hippopotamus amphibius kiboko TaxID=575201 RepID=UPI002591DCCC|nr:B-cell differentiation antigen CD72 [Hippopotamus amphibius kiboko]
MAEAITYADLRFVKAPLKNSVSSRLGQDPEADEDGELTYENVQVIPGPAGRPSLASAGLGDKAGAQPEQPTAAWSPVTSPAAGRILPCHAACMQHLLLGLLLTCLLLGTAAICLGVHYLQVSQQLQQMNRALEATNSTLRQQLHLKITQLEQREEALQGSRRELAESQETLQVEQKVGQATKEQLQACQSEGEKTKEALRNKETQSMNLEQRLSSVQDTLKPFFSCLSPDSCCPLGWILSERRCFYISATKRTWEESQRHCKSLSSDLAIFSYVTHSYGVSHSYGTYYDRNLQKVLTQGGSAESYWIGLRNDKYWQWIDGTKYQPLSALESRHLSLNYPTHGSRTAGFYSRSQKCGKVESEQRSLKAEDCHSSLPSICEMKTFRYPDGDGSLH